MAVQPPSELLDAGDATSCSIT